MKTGASPYSGPTSTPGPHSAHRGIDAANRWCGFAPLGTRRGAFLAHALDGDRGRRALRRSPDGRVSASVCPRKPVFSGVVGGMGTRIGLHLGVPLGLYAHRDPHFAVVAASAVRIQPVPESVSA